MAKKNKRKSRNASRPLGSVPSSRGLNKPSAVVRRILEKRALARNKPSPTPLPLFDAAPSASNEPIPIEKRLRAKKNKKREPLLGVSQSSVKARNEQVHCKKRPDSEKASKGSGGSREFIPWCGR